MKLSKRLEAIASFIPSSGGVIDVGCNHALLCIYIAKNFNNRKIIGIDNRNASLNEARKEILKQNLNQKITLLVNDGLNDILISKDDTIIISGLGTRTIKHILSIKNLEKINHLIIQSNNYLYELRKYLYNHSFYICSEKCIWEGNKFYVIIDFYHSNKKVIYSDFELKYGPYALNDVSFVNYQIKLLDKQILKFGNFDYNKKIILLNDLEKLKKQLSKIK